MNKDRAIRVAALTETERAELGRLLNDFVVSGQRLFSSTALPKVIRTLERSPPSPEQLDRRKLYDLTVSARTPPGSSINLLAALASGGVHTFTQLIAYADDFTKIRGIGPKMAALLKDAVSRFDAEGWVPRLY
jgi:hypothetical protein